MYGVHRDHHSRGSAVVLSPGVGRRVPDRLWLVGIGAFLPPVSLLATFGTAGDFLELFDGQSFSAGSWGASLSTILSLPSLVEEVSISSRILPQLSSVGPSPFLVIRSVFLSLRLSRKSLKCMSNPVLSHVLGFKKRHYVVGGRFTEDQLAIGPGIRY